MIAGLTPAALFAMPAEARPFACLLEPPSLDVRIVAQSAAFTLCSDKRQSFDRFLEQHGLGESLTKIVIPAAECGTIRDQLDLVSVDERRLFPDLDGVAAHSVDTTPEAPVRTMVGASGRARPREAGAARRWGWDPSRSGPADLSRPRPA